MRIGITGQIGSGKSTAAAILESMGAFRIDADHIGRKVVEHHTELRKKLIRAFGSDIVDARGNLNRRLVAQRAFYNKKNKATLDRLVHPYLLRELKAQLKSAEKKHNVVLIDAALIFDWRLESLLDLTIVIHAPRTLRLTRLAKRGISRADALARQGRQLSFAEYRRKSDVVILNNGSIAQLQSKLGRLWNRRIAKAIDR